MEANQACQTFWASAALSEAHNRSLTGSVKGLKEIGVANTVAVPRGSRLPCVVEDGCPSVAFPMVFMTTVAVSYHILAHRRYQLHLIRAGAPVIRRICSSPNF